MIELNLKDNKFCKNDYLNNLFFYFILFPNKAGIC